MWWKVWCLLVAVLAPVVHHVTEDDGILGRAVVHRAGMSLSAGDGFSFSVPLRARTHEPATLWFEYEYRNAPQREWRTEPVAIELRAPSGEKSRYEVRVAVPRPASPSRFGASIPTPVALAAFANERVAKLPGLPAGEHRLEGALPLPELLQRASFLLRADRVPTHGRQLVLAVFVAIPLATVLTLALMRSWPRIVRRWDAMVRRLPAPR